MPKLGLFCWFVYLCLQFLNLNPRPAVVSQHLLCRVFFWGNLQAEIFLVAQTRTDTNWPSLTIGWSCLVLFCVMCTSVTKNAAPTLIILIASEAAAPALALALAPATWPTKWTRPGYDGNTSDWLRTCLMDLTSIWKFLCLLFWGLCLSLLS